MTAEMLPPVSAPAARPDPLREAAKLIDLRYQREQRNPNQAPFPTRSYADLADEDWQWLWDGRIPLGEVSYIEGFAGDGKSSITADIAARVSRGTAMPDDPSPRSPCGVLWFTTEESPTKTIRKRLRIAGADMRNVLDIDLTRLDANNQPPAFTFPSGRARLSATLNDARLRLGVPVRLVIIDGSLSIFDQGMEFTDSQHVRVMLGALRLVAIEHNCAIVLIRHPNKSKGGLAQHRGSGAAGWGDFVRTSLLVGVEPGTKHGDYRRVLVGVKKNAGRSRPGLLFSTEWVEEANEVRVVWGEPTEISADDVYAARDGLGKPQKPKKAEISEAKDLIVEALEPGEEVAESELFKRLAITGLNRTTFDAAKFELKHERAISTWPKNGGWWLKLKAIRRSSDAPF